MSKEDIREKLAAEIEGDTRYSLLVKRIADKGETPNGPVSTLATVWYISDDMPDIEFSFNEFADAFLGRTLPADEMRVLSEALSKVAMSH